MIFPQRMEDQNLGDSASNSTCNLMSNFSNYYIGMVIFVSYRVEYVNLFAIIYELQ